MCYYLTDLFEKKTSLINKKIIEHEHLSQNDIRTDIWNTML
jgi:hypothetical protein